MNPEWGKELPDYVEHPPKPVIELPGARVFLGNNLDVLPSLPDNSVDAIVTDPPYELGFMGKKWDSTGIAYSVELWAECLRVLKPGGHILAFGGSRTWHRLAVAVEDAGFELRDSIAWLYGSGFPKSLDISKAIDKAAGVKRNEILPQGSTKCSDYPNPCSGHNETGKFSATVHALPTAPATDEAKKWAGWGTALKPAFEPVVVGRKPLVGTVAENVLEWGVGGLNIDASRIGTEVINTHNRPAGNFAGGNQGQGSDTENYKQHIGRWPANIILDEFTAGLLDEQSGVTVSKSGGRSTGRNFGQDYDSNFSSDRARTGHNDSGGASRFFYVAKASKRDRNEGLDALPSRTAGVGDNRPSGDFNQRLGTNDKPAQPVANFHPTVKPTDLMRYLIKLVTPAGGVVLDPFTGSGSTGKAALLGGYQFIGIEMTEEYLPIIEGRLRHAISSKVDEATLF